MRLIKTMFKHKRIYLDIAAATPLDLDVYRAMRPYYTDVYGNPSAVHEEGRVARDAIEKAREEVARTLRVRAEGVIFTGSGTESNNLALYGSVRRLHNAGVPFSDIEIITTPIEHPSIEEVLRDLESSGIIVHRCNVDGEGRINTAHLQTLLSDKTALVTFAYVNSEIGTVQDVKRVTRIVRTYNSNRRAKIRVHLDASQAPLWLPCQVDMLGVDLITLDAHKCYGPKGVGVLAHVHGVEIEGIIRGGDQEGGRRAGTENTPLIVGCCCALVKAQKDWKSRSEAVASLRDFLIQELESAVPEVVLNGSRESRVANNVNISIPSLDSEFIVVKLDAAGIAVSTKSACGGAKGGSSSVVHEVTDDKALATSTVRFTLGKETTKRDLLRTVAVLKKHVLYMRSFAGMLEADA